MGAENFNEDAVTRMSAPAHELPVVGHFGKYEVLGRIAWGGMAEIFLAREPTRAGASRFVAIKRILPHVARDEKFLSMFLDEARLAVQLGHPHICHVYDFGEIEGSWYIAMEWVHGATLAKTIKRSIEHGGIPVEVAAKIVSQVSEALSYVHRARGADGQPLHIVHRDVTPHNVMVSFDGNVKLLDFGIARARTQVVETQEGIVKGKLAYMAPEQCRGETIDQRADIFALGVCLYEAVVQRPLYQRRNEFHSLQAILNDPVPSIRDLRSDLSLELDAIVQKCLQKQRDERFRAASEVHEALERWLTTTGHVVSTDRIADMMERIWQEQILSGPTVETTPIARPQLPSVSPAPSPRVRDEAQSRRGVFLVAGALIAGAVIVGGALAFSTGGGDASDSASPRAARIEDAPTPLTPIVPRPDLAIPTSREPEAISPDEEDLSAAATTAAATTAAANRDRDRETQRDRPARHRDPPGPPGYLSINTRPWSKVYVGNTLLGTTPIGRREVPSGRLRLRLVDRDGQEHERTIDLAPDEHERAFFDLSSRAH